VQGMINPATTMNAMNSAVSPAAIRNMAGFADPAMAARWMGAAVDPRFYTQMATQMMDPSKMVRWVMMPADPRWMQVGGQMLNPAQAMQWGMAPADPRMAALAGKMVNPAAYAQMAGAGMAPQSYGATWGQMMPMAPAARPVVAVPSAPAPAKPLVATSVATSVAVATAATTTAVPVVTAKPRAVAAPATPTAPVITPLVATALAPVVQAAKVLTSATAGVIAPAPEHRLSTDMLFTAQGKAQVLTPAGKQALDAVAAAIKAAGAVEQVVVMGHADPMGRANQALSKTRAQAVKAHLVAQGVKPETIVISALGTTQPLVKCDPKASKADKIACNAPNRRIEVEVRKLAPK
jgi:outer membrane protein OmpA-like peptidoglycan-associated protein